MGSPSKRVLICPLNWGLGHATRCIPIIRTLVNAECLVHIASDGQALELLRKEFPTLVFHQLPSYNIRYSKRGMDLSFVLRTPAVLKTIRAEHRSVEELQTRFQFDLIISDNRYGCYVPSISSVIISHQLTMKTPFPFPSRITNWFQRRWFDRFDEVWVPDDPAISLAGELSQPVQGVKSRYIGILSRMKTVKSETVRDILIVLSGPEPQRTIVETKLIQQITSSQHRVLLIRGLPLDNRTSKELGIDYVNFVGAAQLEKLLAESKIVICRSGYTSLMDLYTLGKKAILIPTPGQTEQEYLARYHQAQEHDLWKTTRQENLQIHQHIENLIEENGKGGQSILYVNQLLNQVLGDYGVKSL